MDYYTKYLKYKEKYLSLKYSLYGGAKRYYFVITYPNGKTKKIAYSADNNKIIDENSIVNINFKGYEHAINLITNIDSTTDSTGNLRKYNVRYSGGNWQFEKMDKNSGQLVWFNFPSEINDAIERKNVFNINVDMQGTPIRHQINISNKITRLL